MPQEPKRDDNRLPRFGNRLPEDSNQAPKKGPRFSIYWIYAIIFAILIGFQLFNGALSPSTTKINTIDFKQLIQKQQVQKYTIVDNRKTVKVFLNKAGLDA